MSQVFVSYKREDKACALRIVEALRNEQFEVFWDVDIEVTEIWQARLESELDAAKCVITLWSHASVGALGGFVQDEARRAAARGSLFSVLIDDVLLPLGFGHIQALSLINWSGDTEDPSFRALIRALRKKVDQTSVPAGTPVTDEAPNTRTAPALPRRPFPTTSKAADVKRSVKLQVVGLGIFLVAVALGAWVLSDPETKSWEGTSNPVKKIFGSKDWCLFELELSSIRVLITTRTGSVDSSDVSFVYNEEARKEGCQSSIAPHTLKRLTLDSSRVHADSIHIEYTDATAQPPIVKATLDGKFDKRIGPKHIMGVLTVARIDQPAAIFNWKTQSAVNIDTVKR